jgi:hypothetical protein
MKSHRIIATPWQIEAARRGALKTVILPLVPPPTWNEILQYWEWEVPSKPEWSIEWRISINPEILKHLPYQIGDRLYFAEQWCRSEPYGVFLESTTPDAEMLGWQSAETMPEEPARYWFEVTGVKAERLGQVSFRSFSLSGLHLICPEVDYPSYEHRAAWNRSYPDTPWDDELWVQVLEVKRNEM